MMSDEVREQVGLACDHIFHALMILDDNEDFGKYESGKSLFHFMYKFDPEKDNVRGKLDILNMALINLVTDYRPDPADDKSYREPSNKNGYVVNEKNELIEMP